MSWGCCFACAEYTNVHSLRYRRPEGGHWICSLPLCMLCRGEERERLKKAGFVQIERTDRAPTPSDGTSSNEGGGSVGA